MLRALWNKWKNYQDEKQLAAYAARDAELGTPTKETLTERAVKAARKGLWKTALAAIDAGGDVNATDNWKETFNNEFGRFDFDYKLPLTFIAIERGNADALEQLLAKGADREAVAVKKTNGNERKWSLPEYAALEGQRESLGVVLLGKNKQEALDGALAIAAREESYSGLTADLLAAGAKNFDKALREAEKSGNDRAIVMIRDKLNIEAAFAVEGLAADFSLKADRNIPMKVFKPAEFKEPVRWANFR